MARLTWQEGETRRLRENRSTCVVRLARNLHPGIFRVVEGRIAVRASAYTSVITHR